MHNDLSACCVHDSEIVGTKNSAQGLVSYSVFWARSAIKNNIRANCFASLPLPPPGANSPLSPPFSKQMFVKTSIQDKRTNSVFMHGVKRPCWYQWAFKTTISLYFKLSLAVKLAELDTGSVFYCTQWSPRCPMSRLTASHRQVVMLLAGPLSSGRSTPYNLQLTRFRGISAAFLSGPRHCNLKSWQCKRCG